MEVEKGLFYINDIDIARNIASPIRGAGSYLEDGYRGRYKNRVVRIL